MKRLQVRMKARRKPGRPKGSKNKRKPIPWALVWFAMLVGTWVGMGAMSTHDRAMAEIPKEYIVEHRQEDVSLTKALWNGVKSNIGSLSLL